MERAWTPMRERAVVAALLVASGLFFIFTIRPGHAWGDDFAQYIHHALNLVTGKPYTATGYLYNPAVPFGGPRTYPPIFPLLLAPFVKAFGLNLHALKIENIVFFEVALALVFVYLRRHLSFAVSAGTVALLAFSPFFWDFKDNVLSDVPFLMFVVLSLIVIDRATEAEGEGNPLVWGLLAGAAMYLAYGTRTLGLALPAVLVGMELIRKRKITRVSAIAVVLFGVGAVVQTKLIPGGGSYADDLKLQSVHLALVNTWRYVKALERVAFNGFSMPVAHVFFAGLIALAVAGYADRFRHRRIAPAEVFVPLYAAAVIAWPIYQDTRLLIPLIPFFLAYALAGMRVILRAVRAERFLTAKGVALGVLFVVSYVTLYAKLDFGPITVGVERPASKQVFAYIRSNVPASDVVVFRRPKALALYSSRPSSGYAPGLDDASQIRYFSQVGARYILASTLDPPYLAAFLNRHILQFVPVYHNSDFTLYKIT